ncbi:hypothetical protein ACN6MY_03765 [Peribacillus sp. B-H-3]|uniref:hypothetical protein n=1 Tax=Peribacillus sp. B-H-3 TaxID=3400420 RepID=UPI003B021E6D
MIFLDTMLSKLTDVFQKAKDSNIGKTISLVATQMDDISSTLDRMDEWRDVDLAKGKQLDRIGEEIVGEYRSGASDIEYRLKIKTRIVANFLSRGDIETIIKLLQIYLDEHLINVQEAWSIKDGPFSGEPATLIVTIKGKNEDYGIPFLQLARVVTGGVGIQWEYILETNLTVSSQYQRWMYPFDKYAGELLAGEERTQNDNKVYLSSFELSGSYASKLNDYLICGESVANNKNDNISTPALH